MEKMFTEKEVGMLIAKLVHPLGRIYGTLAATTDLGVDLPAQLVSELKDMAEQPLKFIDIDIEGSIRKAKELPDIRMEYSCVTVESLITYFKQSADLCRQLVDDSGQFARNIDEVVTALEKLSAKDTPLLIRCE